MTRAGRVELAVRRELQELGDPYRKSALAELALVLARQIDARGGDGPSTTVKLVSELRVTLGQLREVARDGGSGTPDGDFSAPVWDAADAGPPDIGPGGGGGGAPSG